jgi:hypothetical protein
MINHQNRSSKKHGKNKHSQSSSLDQQDMNRIAYEIFLTQREQKRQMWNDQCQEFIQFLCSINQHQQLLLTELNKELNQPDTLGGKEPIAPHYLL